MLRRAEPVAGGHLIEQRVHVRFVERVLRVPGTVVVQAGPLPDDVWRDAGTDHGDAVTRALAGRPGVVGKARQRVVARRPEAVTEGSRRPAEQDRRLTLPPGTVGGVESVDVQVASVAVERDAVPVLDAVYRLAAVREPPEQIVCLAVEGPVGPRLEPGGPTGPVREVQLPRPL